MNSIRSLASVAGTFLLVVAGACRAADEPVGIPLEATFAPRWSTERAQRWYEDVGALRGCNYLPRTATNTTEMWQADTFTLDVIDEELGWAEEVGYDALRVFVQFLVWQDDPEGLEARMDDFLRVADSHGMRTMFVLFDDCAFGYPACKDPYLGPQGDPEPGEYSPYWTPSPGHTRVRDRNAWPELEKYVQDIVGTFADDPRVLAWDMYNEPGNSGMGEDSLPLVEVSFAWAREAHPSQPLTVGAYADFHSVSSKRFFALSDVITFHGYDGPGALAEKIRICDEHERPVLCTEVLIRRGGNTFAEFLPLFAREHVGWFQWGLVAGRSHTFYHWGSKKGDPIPPRWQHDVFHGDGTPYDEEELELVRRFRFVETAPLGVDLTSEERVWRYTTDAPTYGWHLRDYDDSSWYEGLAPFGTAETTGVDVRSEWSTPNIWLRRTLDFDNDAQIVNPHLRIRHDEHAEVYVNGVPVATLEGHNSSYDLIPLSAHAQRFLGARPGEILRWSRLTIAVHCHQTWGGQCIDVELVDVVVPDPYAEPPPPPGDKMFGLPRRGGRWSAERVTAYFADRPPLKGCNYLPRTAVNSVEMWRAETFDPRTIDEELGWAAAAGYNSVRVFLQFVVWKNDPAGFRSRFDEFLALADSHGISVMPIFFDDCCFAMKLEPIDGPQDEPVKGLINSGWVPSPGYSLVQDSTRWAILREFVQDIVGAHREDPRIVVWDLYNEPGPYFDSQRSFPLAFTTFRWVRELDPTQPLTIAVWGNPVSARFLELSDVLSIHNYGGGGLEEFFLDQAEATGRPILCTEWLMRPGAGGFADMLPLFAAHRVGWYNWGLVAGRTQTYYAWGSRKGEPMPEVWMCDVLRADGTPYDPAEVELIRAFEFREGARPRILVPTSRRMPQTWRYTTTPPRDGWFAAGFDDSSWAEGPGGFGTPATPGTNVGTRWDGEEIWLRRAFALGDIVPSDPALRIRHDEDVEVYLNGHLVAQLDGYNVSYELVPLVDLGPHPFRSGLNVLAVHCQQTTGGQFIDVGIVDFGN